MFNVRNFLTMFTFDVIYILFLLKCFHFYCYLLVSAFTKSKGTHLCISISDLVHFHTLLWVDIIFFGELIHSFNWSCYFDMIYILKCFHLLLSVSAFIEWKGTQLCVSISDPLHFTQIHLNTMVSLLSGWCNIQVICHVLYVEMKVQQAIYMW